MNTLDSIQMIKNQQKNVDNAFQHYVALVCAPQHFDDDSRGTLHSINVTTQVHHQAYPGATNYHTNGSFDSYLAVVVKNRFSELAKEALELMQKDVNVAMIDLEGELREVLDAIEDLKKEWKSYR